MELSFINAIALLQKGEYTHITDIDDVRYQLGSYYNYFAFPDVNQPVVTVPYVDYSSLGNDLWIEHCSYRHQLLI